MTFKNDGNTDIDLEIQIKGINFNLNSFYLNNNKYGGNVQGVMGMLAEDYLYLGCVTGLTYFILCISNIFLWCCFDVGQSQKFLYISIYLSVIKI